MWKRVVLKLSGEALADRTGSGLDVDVLSQLAGEIVDVRQEMGVDIAVVVGGGNFWRGVTAALRAAEIDANAILKGTHSGVDGVYSADPKKDPTATRYDRIGYIDVINQGLKLSLIHI